MPGVYTLAAFSVMEDPNVASEDTAEQQPNSSQQDDDGNDEANRKKSNVRKRTKTGCLSES